MARHTGNKRITPHSTDSNTIRNARKTSIPADVPHLLRVARALRIVRVERRPAVAGEHEPVTSVWFRHDVEMHMVDALPGRSAVVLKRRGGLADIKGARGADKAHLDDVVLLLAVHDGNLRHDRADVCEVFIGEPGVC